MLLGVRPEHISLASEKSKASIPVTIQVNEMMGSEYHLHVVTNDGTKIIVRIPTINLTDAERESLVGGKVINITFEAKAMHFFDPKTEVNILASGNPVPSAK
ncbi:MAG: TOBE domain-containing protein [Bacilli bacterium]|nr:TOBE domain-containing protein [Bacilli bacterium]